MSATVIYMTVAIVGGILFAAGLIKFLRAHFERSHRMAGEEEAGTDRTVPRSPIEQRAWWGLIITLTTAIVLSWVLLAHGSTSFFINRGTRLLFLAISFGGMIAYLTMLLVTRQRVSRQEVLMDERDRMIIDKAPSVQLVAAFIALGTWTLVLTEVYWEEGQIPLLFADLILWSTFLVCVLARFVGILLGYRKL